MSGTCYGVGPYFEACGRPTGARLNPRFCQLCALLRQATERLEAQVRVEEGNLAAFPNGLSDLVRLWDRQAARLLAEVESGRRKARERFGSSCGDLTGSSSS